MKTQALRFGIALAMSCLVGGAAVAQAPKPPPDLPPMPPARPAPPDPALKEMAKRPTPKMPNGRPDLSGVWFSYTGVLPIEFITKKSTDGSIHSKVDPGGFAALTAAIGPTKNPPQYKPEHQAKLKQMQSQNLNRLDNVFLCGQPGLPRVGAPEQIIQTANQVVLLNADLSGMAYRVVPIGGTYRETDPSYYGVGVAHWEGDTLVIDTRNFSTDTWMGEEGFFHSEQMRVIERLRRVGDTIEYNVTVEDPGVLTKPWTKAQQILKKTDAPLEEPFPCDPKEAESGIDELRHDQRAK